MVTVFLLFNEYGTLKTVRMLVRTYAHGFAFTVCPVPVDKFDLIDAKLYRYQRIAVYGCDVHKAKLRRLACNVRDIAGMLTGYDLDEFHGAYSYR